MKPDISNREDIQTVVDKFYEKVNSDDELSVFFNDVVVVNWKKHIPLMVSFWENMLFYTGEYHGNPLVAHRSIHQKHATRGEHFNRWLQLWESTVDQLFAGTNANKMKEHAKAIATVMMEKI